MYARTRPVQWWLLLSLLVLALTIPAMQSAPAVDSDPSGACADMHCDHGTETAECLGHGCCMAPPCATPSSVSGPYMTAGEPTLLRARTPRGPPNPPPKT